MEIKMYEKQKEKILKMLNRHYEIDKNVNLFIRTIASNEEELQDLQILALAVMGKERVFEVTNTNKKHTVLIKAITSPIMLIKAIKAVCDLPLKEAKYAADLMMEKHIFTIEEFFTNVQQWHEISNICKDDLQWEYQD